MSTRQEWGFALDAGQAQRALVALEEQRRELARLQAERCAAIHGEVQSIAQAHAQLMQGHAARQGSALSQAEAELALLRERARAVGARLDSLAERAESSRQEIEQAQTEVHRMDQQITALKAQSSRLEGALLNVAARASGGLDQVGRTAAASLAATSAIGEATRSGSRFSEVQAGLERRMQEMESRIRFVTQRAEFAPVAMATLQAMEENGYRLQDTISRDGLTLYFKQEGAAHQLAVRMASERPESEGAKAWSLLAETFDVAGSSCLDEMKDFETALEVRGTLSRRGDRVYPRDDRQAALPRPIRRQRANAEAQHAKRTRT